MVQFLAHVYKFFNSKSKSKIRNFLDNIQAHIGHQIFECSDISHFCLFFAIPQNCIKRNFITNFQDYLESHKYRNADHDDLWSALNRAVPDTLLSWEGDKLDIRDFASKWTQQVFFIVAK